MKKLLFSLFLALLPHLPLHAGTPPSELPFRNPDLPIEQRIDDLISRLTVEEKISQTMMGSPAIERLRIPEYDWWNEGLHGVARSGLATVFPQAIALAATWNPELHQRIADVISTEARAKNNDTIAKTGGGTKRYQGLTIWSPNINIFRDPRWGRGQETYGEDPFLTGRFAVAFVRGLQGNDPHYLKTVATVKHFAVHSGPEPARHHFNAVASERDLWETYLPAFEAGTVEGGSRSLMSAYNAVNGIPAPASRFLLQDVLRDRWKFKGAVVGDVDNVADLWKPRTHQIVKTAAEASALAIKAGNDLCSGKTYAALKEALEKGLVTEADIDQALRRLFTLRFQLGQFDPPERVPFRSIPISENNSPAHDQLALEAARQSLVLLKNDGALPWNVKQLKKVAILGPTGDEKSALLGNYSGTPSKKITLAAGLKARLEAHGVEVMCEPGVPLVKGFRMSGLPFAPGVLFTDESRQKAGLKAEVFAHEKRIVKTTAVEAAPFSTRIDEQVDLQWDETQPIEDIPHANAALRWTGILVPPKTGDYPLGIVVEGGVRLFIDDRLVIDSWTGEAERTLSSTIPFEAGRVYRVKLEYAQMRFKGRIQLGWIVPGDDDRLQKAMNVARAADHIVLTLGLTPDLEGEEMRVTAEGFDGGDRTTIALPETQRELLEKVAALKKPTVVLLTTGSALSFEPEHANAVLLCWYYGQRGADAVADALLGETNPAGRLPITFYRDLESLPAFTDYSMKNRTYRYYTGQPLYAFGHGLSYAQFKYESIELSPAVVGDSGKVLVKATVRNTSDRAGDEVVQVYATAQDAPVPMPLRQLVGFQRVPFAPGETKTIEIEVPASRLRRWDESASRYVVDTGAWQFAVGPASDQPLLKATLTLGAATSVAGKNGDSAPLGAATSVAGKKGD